MVDTTVFIAERRGEYFVMVHEYPRVRQVYGPFDSYENASLCGNIHAARKGVQFVEGIYARKDED